MKAGADKKNGEAASPAATKKEPPSKAVKIIARAIEDPDDSDNDGWANLSGVGSRTRYIHGVARSVGLAGRSR